MVAFTNPCYTPEWFVQCWMLTWPTSCENGHVCFVDSDSNSKRRRRYSNIKRRGVAPSPKQGASGKGQGQGQNKAGGAYDSDAERNKPRRRKQRRTHRRAAETVDGTTPTVEGEGPMEDGGVGQGRVHVRHHKSHRSHGSTSHGQSTMTSARASPPKSHRSPNCYLACHVRMVWLRSISWFLQTKSCCPFALALLLHGLVEFFRFVIV